MLKDLLGELYTEDIAAKLGEKQLAVVNDGSWIPRDKFNTVTNEIKELKKQLTDRDDQLEQLKSKAAGNDELLKQLEDLKAANQQTMSDYESRLQAQAKEFAIDKAISEAMGKNPKAIKALLNLDAVTINGDSIIGLSEQIEALKTSDSYLFNTTQPPLGGGTNPPGGGGNALTLDQQIEEAVRAGNVGLSIQLKNKKFLGV